MRQSKHEYFTKGTDSETTPDIVFDFRRKAKIDFNNSIKGPEGIIEWLDTVEKRFKDFKKALIENINEQRTEHKRDYQEL